MLRELIVSVVSGIIVAIILQMFSSRRHEEASPPPMRRAAAPQPRSAPRRGTFVGGLMRFIFAVAGGMGLAYVAAQMLHLRHMHVGRSDSLASHAPLLVLTILGTVVVWALLSALKRR